ncbi:MAG: hypothetical protein IJ343_02955 [Clostridia bacterium]|nr:hypothetical protein [Clostridia bacterium]
MTYHKKHTFYDSRVVKALTPLAVALLAVVCISGIFIYPFLISAASHASSAVGQLAGKLLITALVAQIAALVPAMLCSFTTKDFSISLTLVLSLSAAVFFSWLAMLIQQISPLGGIGGFSGGVLNVMFTALIGSVLSVGPALLATFICVLRRVIANLISGKKL